MPFIGLYSGTDAPVGTIAASIDEIFGVRHLALAAGNREEFIRELTRNIESRGILMMRSKFALLKQNRRLNVDEFRGFAITDDLAPLISINAEDGLGAQVFTIIHELAHLFLGVSGISNPNYRTRVGIQGNDIENRCDEVTAETLMPHDEFLLYWRDNGTVAENLVVVTSRYRASNLAAIRRARDLDKVSDEVYWDYFRTHSNHGAVTPDGGGSYYPTFFVRNGRLLASAVVQAVSEGRLPYREAAELLNVRVKTLDGVARELFGTGVLA